MDSWKNRHHKCPTQTFTGMGRATMTSKSMARLAGLEPATYFLEGNCFCPVELQPGMWTTLLRNSEYYFPMMIAFDKMVSLMRQ